MFDLRISENEIIDFSLFDSLIEFFFLFLYFLFFSDKLIIKKCHTDFPDCSNNEKVALSLLIWLVCVGIEKLVPEFFCFLVPMEQFGSILGK